MEFEIDKYGVLHTCHSQAETIVIPEEVKYILTTDFSYCSNVKTIIIPESISAIGLNFPDFVKLIIHRPDRIVTLRLLDSLSNTICGIEASFLSEPSFEKFSEILLVDYQVQIAVFYYDIDTRIRNFLQEHISIAFQFVIQEQLTDTFQNLLRDGFVTAENIDTVIETAIECTQQGANPEFQLLLMHYKAEKLGYSDPMDKFKL